MKMKGMKVERARAEMSQFDLSQKLNISEKTVSGIETGRVKPNHYMLQRIADVLKCEVDDLK